MEGNYSVIFGKDLCGKVQIQRQGLYYRFICRCRISGDILCRLRVTCGGKQEDLGIVVPMEDGFGLDRKIPVKRIGAGIPEFRLYPSKEPLTGTFVPIFPEEPFSYIARLKSAYLIYRNGQAGILVK